MNPEELQTQIDDINTRLDESDTSLQEFSDNLDSNFLDVSTSIEEQGTAIDELTQNSGQLTYPLNQDTIDLITEQTPTMFQYMKNSGYLGTVTLVAGSATITNGFLNTNSLVILSHVTLSNPGTLGYSVTGNTMTITSSNGADVSTVLYLILY